MSVLIVVLQLLVMGVMPLPFKIHYWPEFRMTSDSRWLRSTSRGNVDARFWAHQSHQSSNWLMNLVERAADVTLDGRYEMTPFVVFLCWRPEHGTTGEIVLTRLAHAYWKDGTGMNTYDPYQTEEPVWLLGVSRSNGQRPVAFNMGSTR